VARVLTIYMVTVFERFLTFYCIYPQGEKKKKEEKGERGGGGRRGKRASEFFQLDFCILPLTNSISAPARLPAFREKKGKGGKINNNFVKFES